MLVKQILTNFTQDDINKYNIPSGGAKDSWFVGYTPQYTADRLDWNR
ncbi:hypothetical protein ACEQPO_17185 [Bacillus sp. SL00103]